MSLPDQACTCLKGQHTLRIRNACRDDMIPQRKPVAISRSRGTGSKNSVTFLSSDHFLQQGPRSGMAMDMNVLNFQVCALALLFSQSCLTLRPPGLYSPPGPSVHGISQQEILEWVAISFFRGSSQPRD